MTRVLVPVEILGGKTVSPGLMNLLGTVDVTVLGYHVLPEQTPPDQARHQYEERATDALEDLSEEFRTAGGAADHRLVFTHDREQTVDRVADETGAGAIAISGVTGDVDRLLVPLSGNVAVDRILAFLEELVGGRDIGVTLLLAGDPGSEAPRDDRLESAAERLRDRGLDVRTERTTQGPFDSLVGLLPGHDAIVMGEKAPSFRSFVFGDETDRVASASVGPVIAVRYDDSIDE
jgi:nucleotide-binding universal stress UspA family protein